MEMGSSANDSVCCSLPAIYYASLPSLALTPQPVDRHVSYALMRGAMLECPSRFQVVFISLRSRSFIFFYFPYHSVPYAKIQGHRFHFHYFSLPLKDQKCKRKIRGN